MKFKRLPSIIIFTQVLGCGVYEVQQKDSIQVHNQGIESRVNALEKEVNQLREELTQMTTKKIENESLITKEESETKVKLSHTENAKEDFESSFELLRKGDYVSAEVALRNYIELFPQATYTDDAKFWLAESLYAQTKFSEALVIFNQIIDEYPDSEKMMESILKSGFSHQELGDMTTAKAIFQRVIREYPNSSASSLAKERLSKIRQ
jgi:tol-pal system protein YbgF